MKTLLFTALAFIGFAICAPQAEARDYGRKYSGRHYSGNHYSGRHYNHGYYRGYSRAYYPYRSYYRSSYYYPRARYYYGGYAYPRYYSSYYGGCGYPGYYGYGPRLSVSFGF